jgi:hypothetical protein
LFLAHDGIPDFGAQGGVRVVELANVVHGGGSAGGLTHGVVLSGMRGM